MSFTSPDLVDVHVYKKIIAEKYLDFKERGEVSVEENLVKKSNKVL